MSEVPLRPGGRFSNHWKAVTMAQKRPGDSQPLSIGSILPDVIRTCRRENDAGMTAVWDVWESAVGSATAANTQPAAFKGRLLLVHVSSSVWLHQLQFVKADLIEKINDACGKRLVEDITFKIGPLEVNTGADD